MRVQSIPRDEGYTLTELLIVLGILALLAVVIAPQLVGGLARARGDVARLQVQRIAAALDLYSVDAGTYPTTEQGLRALVAKPGDNARWRGPYLQTGDNIVDPWGAEFHYLSPGVARPYDLFTYGQDQREGGSGDDADIRSH